MKRTIWLAAILMAVMLSGTSWAATLYVDYRATGANTGLTWPDAFTNLNSACATALADDQIWVAQGTYRPAAPNAARTNCFTLPHRVAIYGGFTNGMATVSNRNWRTYPTVLSGDLNNNDSANFGGRADNVYHVMRVEYVKVVTLDGFIVAGGTADGGTFYTDENAQGGALRTLGAESLVLRNCIFADNSAVMGGAVLTRDARNPSKAIDCVFSGNRSTEGDNDGGSGAVGNYGQGYWHFDRCLFSGNSATGGVGGAFYSGTGTNTFGGYFTNCLVVGNESGYNGGAGGGLYFRGCATNPAIVNSTFYGNRPTGVAVKDCTVQILNSILWGSVSNEFQIFSGSFVPRYTDVNSNGYAGVNGNIQVDPAWKNSVTGSWSAAPTYVRPGMTLLVNASAGWTVNEHAGKTLNPDTNQFRQFCIVSNTATTLAVWGDATTLGLSGRRYSIHDFRLSIASDCVDAGSPVGAPSLDLDGAARPQGRSVDMGAYEYPSGAPTTAVVYVKSDAAGLNNGSSWANAYTLLQSALGAASVGSEIWVAAGTYKPTATSRTNSFVLKAGVGVFGGFAGTEVSRAERSVRANVTILSGDLSGNDASDDLSAGPTHANRIDNSYHVVRAASDGILDGFAIVSGYANDASDVSPEYYGGGVHISSGSLVVSNCVFEGNYAYGGGAVAAMAPATPAVVNCVFSGNWAQESGGCAFSDSTPVFDANLFCGSHSVGSGGALMFNGQKSPLVRNCVFAGGYASFGGAIRVDGGVNRTNTLRVVNCTITGNQGQYCGAVYVKRASNPGFVNTILWDDSATEGGSPAEIGLGGDAVSTARVTVSYCDLAGGTNGIPGGPVTDGGGILTADPTFATPVTGTWAPGMSYSATTRRTTLTANAANWLPGSLSRLIVRPDTTMAKQFVIYGNTANQLTVWGDASQVAQSGDTFTINSFAIPEASPCRDTGTAVGAPAADILGTARPQRSGYDIGAYENAEGVSELPGAWLFVR